MEKPTTLENKQWKNPYQSYVTVTCSKYIVATNARNKLDYVGVLSDYTQYKVDDQERQKISFIREEDGDTELESLSIPEKAPQYSYAPDCCPAWSSHGLR